MRIRIWLQAACALGLLALPNLMLGQFQDPTPEELKMTAEPKAPGAAAIYLYREETVDDNLHYHSSYARIKVLTEKGKELATVTIPYLRSGFTITDIKARTIHADGTVIPLDVKPSDLVAQKEGKFQVNKMVFTLPSVEVGSILEYHWQLRYDDDTLSSPEWEIQQPYFVRKAHYSFIPFAYLERVTNSRGDAANNLTYSAMLPDGVKVVHDPLGRYFLDLTDISPEPDEEYMPPMESWLENVRFYYSPYGTMDDFWKKEGERWSKEADHFAEQSNSLKDAVAGIVAPADSEDVKAHKIYDAVMALENTDYTRRKSAAELKELHLKNATNAEEVWKQKSGTSNEIALLYVAMARIAGLKAYAFLVCNRDSAIFNPYYMSMSQFDADLAIVEIDGKPMALDPGKKFAPFGQLSWTHVQVDGLRQSDKGPVFAQTPINPFKEAATVRLADLTIGKDGSVKGQVRIAMNGPEAMRWRERAVENDEDEVKKQFNEYMHDQVPDGVTADFDHFLGLEDYHSQLMAVLTVSGNMGTATGKRMFLPGVFFESHAKHPFVAADKRQTAVDMHFAESVKDEVTYRLPDSFAIESAPPDAQVPWAGHAVLDIKSVPDKDQITVTRVLIRNFVLALPKDYPDLRGFYQKVATADQGQLVLKAAPAGTAGSPLPAASGK